MNKKIIISYSFLVSKITVVLVGLIFLFPTAASAYEGQDYYSPEETYIPETSSAIDDSVDDTVLDRSAATALGEDLASQASEGSTLPADKTVPVSYLTAAEEIINRPCEPKMQVLSYLSYEPGFLFYKGWFDALNKSKKGAGTEQLTATNQAMLLKAEELVGNRKTALDGAKSEYASELQDCLKEKAHGIATIAIYQAEKVESEALDSADKILAEETATNETWYKEEEVRLREKFKASSRDGNWRQEKRQILRKAKGEKRSALALAKTFSGSLEKKAAEKAKRSYQQERRAVKRTSKKIARLAQQRKAALLRLEEKYKEQEEAIEDKYDEAVRGAREAYRQAKQEALAAYEAAVARSGEEARAGAETKYVSQYPEVEANRATFKRLHEAANQVISRISKTSAAKGSVRGNKKRALKQKASVFADQPLETSNLLPPKNKTRALEPSSFPTEATLVIAEEKAKQDSAESDFSVLAPDNSGDGATGGGQGVLVCPTKEWLLGWQQKMKDGSQLALNGSSRNLECLRELSKTVSYKIFLTDSDYYPGPAKIRLGDFSEGKNKGGIKGKSCNHTYKNKPTKAYVSCIDNLMSKGLQDCSEYLLGECTYQQMGFWSQATGVYGGTAAGWAKQVAAFRKQNGLWDRYDRVEFSQQPTAEDKSRLKKSCAREKKYWGPQMPWGEVCKGYS